MTRRRITLAVSAALVVAVLGAAWHIGPRWRSTVTTLSDLGVGRCTDGAASGTYAWLVETPGNEAVTVRLEAPGEDLEILLVGPHGAEIRRRAYPLITDRPLEVSWLAVAPGAWRLEVTASDPSAPGPLCAMLLARRAAGPDDTRRWNTDLLEDRSLKRLDEGVETAEAVANLERVVAARERLLARQPMALATALFRLGIQLADHCSESPNACTLSATVLRRSLDHLAGSPEAPALYRAEILTELSWVEFERGRWQECRALDQEVLEIRRRHLPGGDPRIGESTLDLALAHYHLGDNRQAETLMREALEFFLRSDESHALEIANAYLTLAEIARRHNRFGDAEEALNTALSYAQDGGEEARLPEARIRNSLGGLYFDQGEYGRALSEYQRSLRIREESSLGSSRELSTAHLNLGAVYRSQGDAARAEESYLKALELAERSLGGAHSELAWYFDQVAELYVEQERPADARPLLERSLALAEKALGEKHRDTARARCRLAQLLVELGEHGEADLLFRRALDELAATAGPDDPEIAVCLTRYADNERKRPGGVLASARERLDHALKLFGGTLSYPEMEAEGFRLRAELHASAGDRRAAIEDLERSLDIVEGLRYQAGGGTRTRERFVDRFRAWYERMIGWQLASNRIDEAIRWVERSRAQTLVSNLKMAGVDPLESVPADVRRSLEAKQVQLLGRLAEAQARLAALESSVPQEPEEMLASVRAELAALDDQWGDLQERIANSSQQCKLTTTENMASLSQIQTTLVPADGLMLLYHIGAERSWLFLIPAAGAPARAAELAIGPTDAARLGVESGPLTRTALRTIVLRVLSSLASISPTCGPGAAPRDPQPELLETLHALRRVLVPDGTWHRVASVGQAVIIGDGVLHRLPFEVLVIDLDSPESRTWLDEGPVLRYAPSASALLWLLKRGRVAAPSSGGPIALSVSDPVFTRASASEEAPTGTRRGKLAPSSASSVYQRLFGPLARLPYSAEESASVVHALGGGRSGGPAVVALRRREAEEIRVREEIGGKRILHFATHGLVSEGRDATFAALALTPPSEPAGSDNDGFLQLFELYRLPIDCELATLSACRTNAAADSEAEGAFALSRAFLIAGARRVVASAWSVDDRATASLMSEFFTRVGASIRAGERPAYDRALQQAKLALRNAPESSHPYCWGAFTITGIE